MEKNIDLLQIKIGEARKKLPEKSREAIDFVKWKMIILEMLGKYSPAQLEELETETELLLCGITPTEDYPHELETRMHLTKDEVNSLLEDMDKLVFKKIQKELERKMDEEEEIPYPDKKTTLDPRFSGMSKEIQQAIADSNYQVALYTIGSKYNIKVEQLGLLEETTIKLILGEIHPEQYEKELASKLTVSKENLSNLIKDVNDNILVKIREGEKVITNDQLPITNKKKNNLVTNDEGIPLPPYKVIANDKLPITNIKEGIFSNKQDKDDIPLPPYKIITNDQLPITKEADTSKSIENTKDNQPGVEKLNTPLNIMEEKLKGAMASDHTVSDYSLPKVNTISDVRKDGLNISGKRPDPYREEI